MEQLNQNVLNEAKTEPVLVNQNNSLVILLSVLLLLSVSIAGFFAYQTQNLVKELTSLKSSPTPVSSTEPDTDPTSDWKTYTNEKVGFILRYPNTWFEVNGSLSTRYECSTLNFSSKTSSLSLSEFLSKEYNDIDYKTNMKPATSLIDGRESQTFGSQGIGEIKTVYIKDKTNIVTINQTAIVPEGGDPDKYWEKNCKQFDIETDEILSTLKFIS
ncbi:MAG: PsbP-related protein [Microgenomates group bacterium]